MTVAAQRIRRRRPLLGLRRQPGRVALWFMRLPRPLYHHHLGWLLDHTFLLIAHEGRKTGKRHETVAMAATYEPATHEVVVCSAWGPETEWIRNLRAHPAPEIRIGRESFVPEQRFLSEDEAAAAVAEFLRRHPWRVRLFAAILGWGDLSSEPEVRDFVRHRPFVSFRPSREAGSGREAQSSVVALTARGAGMLLRRRVRFPREDMGRTLTMEDGAQFIIFRHAIVDDADPPAAALVVRFTPEHMSVRQNIWFSLLPMIPLLGMRGFREKRWCVNKKTGECQGIYAWQTRGDAEAYADSVALRFMTRRSSEASVSHQIVDRGSARSDEEVDGCVKG